MRASLVKGICTAGFAAALSFFMVACSSESGATGGVAATVNGVEIAEDDVTAYIEDIRANVAAYYSDAESEDDAWGEYLVMVGETPASIRETVIENQFVQRELIRQGAAEQGIAIESSTIDEYVDKMRSYYESDEAWQNALSQLDMTEEDYRESIELALLNEQLQEKVAPETEPTEEELVSGLNENLAAWDGAKRSSHILFDAGDESTAQSVLDQINAGTLDFAAAAEQYSKDGSASNGGDVGWDKLSSFVDEYQTALDGLSVGQVSGLVTSQYGIHIIKCTEEFAAPESVTSSSEVPSEFVDEVRSQLESTDSSTAYQEWLDEYRESADVVINEMPENVPYNIDMTPYTQDETTDESATDESSSSGDASSAEESDDAITAESADTATGDASASESDSETASGEESSVSNEDAGEVTE